MSSTASRPADAAPRPSVLCLGETMALVTPREAVRLRTAETFAIKAGGAESTVAMYVADSGHVARWVSWLGDDPLGERILDELRAHGVDVSAVRRRHDAPTAVYLKDPGDGDTTVYYYRAGSAASRMDESVLRDIDWSGAAVLHVTGITAGLSESCAGMLAAVVAEARRRGVTVSFDVNYRPRLWPVETAAPRLAALAAGADIVFVGRDEAETLWGDGDAARLRSALGIAGRLVVKDGDIGATEVWSEDGIDRRAFVPANTVDVVEPVGAGDAFTGGYLVGLLEGEGPEGRLRRGHRFAARALGSTHDFVPRGAV
ncbi:sugar kinase [Microbacterium sp. Marseille-Q6965]|uniref:sugar kinase n=1 Tax=Microbacterium sp. Marseille-Q6965 TaxID=2965072 RepID=UPI0021B7C66A|nr:sugar kinase [Microbacterium sp. Marseille-Q6965]